MKEASRWLYDILLENGVSQDNAALVNATVLAIAGSIILLILDYILKLILRRVSSRIAKVTKTPFDDFLIQNSVPRRVAHILPLVIAYRSIPVVFQDFPDTGAFFSILLKLFGIILTLFIVRSFLLTLKDYFKTLPKLMDKPIDSFIQVFMIFLWFIAVFLSLAVIIDLQIGKFLGGLGAVSAVIILIFRDTILGFVASIQVSLNDMVRIGDWITFEKYGADGDVTEINLATVKVQNFDMTITTIPTYALISDSFKNWRGMTNSPGRRIKRSLLIKQGSIHFLRTEDIERLKGIERITDYLTTMSQKVDKANKGVNKELALNGLNLTNFGVFRKYVETYLQQHSAINKDMFLMVRQLQPTSQGIPLEVYCFSSDKRWENYEYIMADIFDHLLASIGFFNLEIFEFDHQGKYINA